MTSNINVTKPSICPVTANAGLIFTIPVTEKLNAAIPISINRIFISRSPFDPYIHFITHPAVQLLSHLPGLQPDGIHDRLQSTSTFRMNDHNDVVLPSARASDSFHRSSPPLLNDISRLNRSSFRIVSFSWSASFRACDSNAWNSGMLSISMYSVPFVASLSMQSSLALFLL